MRPGRLKSCSARPPVFWMDWGPERALARGQNALRGRQEGGNRKTSGAEAAGLEGVPTRSVLQKRAGGRLGSQAVARGAGSRREAAAGPSARVSECEAAAGGRAAAGECAREGGGARRRGPGPPSLPASAPASRPRAPAARRRRSCSRRRCTGACPPPPALCFPQKMGSTSS